MDGDRYQFEPIGITPPRGRLGHSVPTPKPLGNSMLVKPTAVANGAVAMENGKVWTMIVDERTMMKFEYAQCICALLYWFCNIKACYVMHAFVHTHTTL